MTKYSGLQMTNEELVQIYQDGNLLVLEQLITANMGMVHKIAKKFMRHHGSKYDYDDLLQEGSVGLILAAERYKFDESTLFITYASYYIYQCISSMVNSNNSDDYSLDKPMVTVDDELTFGDTIADDRDYYEQMIEGIYQESIASDVRASIETMLDDNEKTVIKTRYGIGMNEYMTLCETGKLLNLTKGRVRQIETKSIRKLRNSCLIQRHAPRVRELDMMLDDELALKDIDRGRWNARIYNF